MHVDLVAINTKQEKQTLLIQIDHLRQLYKVFDIQQMANQGTIDIGPWGGAGGVKWDVKPPSINSSIKEITINYGDIVNSFSFKINDRTNGQTIPWPIYGGNGPKTKQALLGPNEYLTSINGTIKDYNGILVVESLTFISKDGTNTKTYGPYGPSQTIGFSFTGPIENGEVVGFFGGATPCQYINAIGIHVKFHPN